MEIWRNVLKLSVITLVFTFLLTCSSCSMSSEPDNTADAQSEIIQPSDNDAEDLPEQPEQVEDVPKIDFDPENTKDGMVMMYVPEGEFEMGTNDEQRDRLIAENIWDSRLNNNEQPIHTVFLDAFWIDQTEVTNGQFALCVADGACQEPHSSASDSRISYYGDPEFKDYPVTYVDWYMAEAYCAWVGRRLPTEAEWEKAARGTDGRIYPWGDEIDDALANYSGYNRENGDTTPVGSYPNGASPYGVLDMAGNVWEWVADVYDFTYYSNSPTENPLGPVAGSQHVNRGGSWMANENAARAAARYKFRANYADFPSGGFRCAATP